MNIPISFSHIYDIFHNDNNNLVIISPAEKCPEKITYKNIQFTSHSCPHNHTYIYVLNTQTKYNENIELNINGKIVKTKVNKYPEFKDEIIMSTIILNEDNYIIQWIKFHLNIGITRFIIYDNNVVDGNLKNILNNYILEGIVILIKWPYPYLLKKSGVSGQTTHQNHSIWAFRNSKYIGLFDVDEYLNMQQEINIHDFFTKLIIDEKIDTSKIGSFRLLNKYFYNPHNLPTNDFEFLKIYNCNNITLVNCEKNFVIPKNVFTFSVHMITKGYKMYNVCPKKLYFNHYYFLNKPIRGRDKTDISDNSIYRHTLKL